MAKLMMTLLMFLLPVFSYAQTSLAQYHSSDFDLDYVTSLRANYASTIEKLNNQAFVGICQDQQRELNRVKTADLERRSEQADYSIETAFQQKHAYLRAYTGMLLPSLQVELAELNLKICKIHQSPGVDDSSISSRRTQQLYCYRDAQLLLHRTRVEWQTIDSKFSSSPEQAFMEKVRSYDSKMVYMKCD